MLFNKPQKIVPYHRVPNNFLRRITKAVKLNKSEKDGLVSNNINRSHQWPARHAPYSYREDYWQGFSHGLYITALGH